MRKGKVLSILLDNSCKVRKKATIRNQYNQVPQPTKDTTWESDKNTKKHYTQNNKDHNPFPAGNHKAARNRQNSMKDKHKHKYQIGPRKEAAHGNGPQENYLRAKTYLTVPASSAFLMWVKTNRCLINLYEGGGGFNM